MLDAPTPVLDHPLLPPVREALTRVDDPEIKKPITELGMVAAVEVDATGQVRVEVLLTVSGCPMKDTLRREVTAAVSAVEGVTGVRVDLGVMSDEQRVALREQLKGGQTDREIPFAQPGLADQGDRRRLGQGRRRQVLGHRQPGAGPGRGRAARSACWTPTSTATRCPAMLGVADARPTSVEDMILPVPSNGLKVISIGMLKPRRDQVIAWRGPILDRALTQMLADVYWGDLDYLLLDLPPGTGDVAISLGQKLPNAEVLVVTTPQAAAAEVAERAGTMASMMNQRVIGVVENMSYLAVTCPHCGEEQRHEVFGSGGGQDAADGLTTRLGYDVPLLAQVPLDPQLRAGGDEGAPVVTSAPAQPSAQALAALADGLDRRGRGLLGRQLGLAPAGR